ncbi:hypothetical protein APT63_11375 [Pseudomonas sp. 22-AL-CL-001]|nr:hypothetical protein APT63_11375 [Pseudomonas monteilii]
MLARAVRALAGLQARSAIWHLLWMLLHLEVTLSFFEKHTQQSPDLIGASAFLRAQKNRRKSRLFVMFAVGENVTMGIS